MKRLLSLFLLSVTSTLLPERLTADVLINTYNVNYRFNSSGCFPPGGDFGNVPASNPFLCLGSPHIASVPSGKYKVVTKGFGPAGVANCLVWSGDASGGTRYATSRTIGGSIEIDHTFGQLAFYFWDWLPEDNDPNQSTEVELYALSSLDIVPNDFRWNPSPPGGFECFVDIEMEDLEIAVDIAVFWATGSSVNDVIGAPFQEFTLPPLPIGRYGPFSFSGPELLDAPPATSHLLVVVDPSGIIDDDSSNNELAMLDVQLSFGPNARKDVLSEFTVGVLKGNLRLAGEASALITSTFRTPEDQARIMFANIKNKKGDEGIYKGPGQEVLKIYKKLKKTNANDAEIIAAMADRIGEFPDPGVVSRHCGNFAMLQVVDIDPLSVLSQWLFEIAIESDSRINNVLSPPKDPAYHIEIRQ